jgi:thiol:disulfide interchange protein DsbC
MDETEERERMTLIRKPLILVGALLGLLVQGAHAEVDADVAKAIKTRLQSANPKASYGDVRESPIDGLYEIEVDGTTTLYVSKDGSHFVYGDLFQVKSGELVNLSEQRRAGKRARVMESLDTEDMIVFPAKGKKKAGHRGALPGCPARGPEFARLPQDRHRLVLR